MGLFGKDDDEPETVEPAIKPGTELTMTYAEAKEHPQAPESKKRSWAANKLDDSAKVKFKV